MPEALHFEVVSVKIERCNGVSLFRETPFKEIREKTDRICRNAFKSASCVSFRFGKRVDNGVLNLGNALFTRVFAVFCFADFFAEKGEFGEKTCDSNRFA